MYYISLLKSIIQSFVCGTESPGDSFHVYGPSMEVLVDIVFSPSQSKCIGSLTGINSVQKTVLKTGYLDGYSHTISTIFKQNVLFVIMAFEHARCFSTMMQSINGRGGCSIKSRLLLLKIVGITPCQSMTLL